MKCSKCNTELQETDNFCPNCGEKRKNIKVTQTDTTTIVESKNNYTEYKKPDVNGMDNATKLCVASLICYFSGPILNLIFGDSAFSGVSLLSLLALPLCIYARVKYPESKFAKVLLIIYIVQIVLGIIGIILMAIVCYSVLSSCDGGLGFF